MHLLSRGKLAAHFAAAATMALAAAALPACTHGDRVRVAAPSASAAAAPGESTGAVTAVTAVTAATTDGALGDRGDHGDHGLTDPNASWIGARAVHDVVLAKDGQADIGLWVDAPGLTRSSRRPKVDVALVIDVSGSMSGAKFQNAKEAARTIVSGLVDGDIVSIDSFDDRARSICPPLVLDAHNRTILHRAIDGMTIGGNTNMFDGLELAEMHAAQAPSTHAVRRVVMLSDGQANVGASSPELLGEIAERGLGAHTQVTSIGLGLDYSEQTLDALAVRSGGRMYHLTDSAGVSSTLRDELALLTSAVASDAYVEVIPAPGVRVERIFGVGGWHGEATASSDGGTPTLRIRTSDDAREVASSASPQAQAIATTALASEEVFAATQDAEKGDFAVASKKLAVMSTELRHRAASAPAAAKPRMLKAADDADEQSRAAGAAATAAAAPAARRETVLKMNSYSMKQSGF